MMSWNISISLSPKVLLVLYLELINKELVKDYFNAQVSVYSTDLKQEPINHNEIKPSRAENKLSKIKGKVYILKTGKMLHNEKMKASELLFNVKDSQDYDYLLKAISNSIKKKPKLKKDTLLSADKIGMFYNNKKRHSIINNYK